MNSLYHPNLEMDKMAFSSLADQGVKLDHQAKTSRRSFFGRTATTAAVGAAAVVGASSVAKAASPLPSIFPGGTALYFQELQYDEAAHVNILAGAIQSEGGTVRPFPTFQGITNLSASDFLNISLTLANVSVGGLTAGSRFISSSAVYSVAASILFVEAYHAGFIASTANVPLVPNGLVYDVPLSLAQITTAVTPYIASLNDPNNLYPASFSTTVKSNANDIAILNFAIILSQLQASLYFNNVGRLFG